MLIGHFSLNAGLCDEPDEAQRIRCTIIATPSEDTTVGEDEDENVMENQTAA